MPCLLARERARKRHAAADRLVPCQPGCRRRGSLRRFRGLEGLIATALVEAGCGAAFAATGLPLGRHPGFLLAGNVAVGLGSGWVVAAQTTFANLAPPERMGQVTATMVASLVVLEGAGAVGFGAVASRFGVGPAYLMVGMVLLTTGLIVGWRAPAELT